MLSPLVDSNIVLELVIGISIYCYNYHLHIFWGEHMICLILVAVKIYVDSN